MNGVDVLDVCTCVLILDYTCFRMFFGHDDFGRFSDMMVLDRSVQTVQTVFESTSDRSVWTVRFGLIPNCAHC